MIDLASAPNRPTAARKLTLLPLIASTYFIVAGGPFGLEDIVATAGYSGAIAILLLTPLLWALPAALMVSELASAIPAEGGYYVWATRGLGRFWGFQEAWLSLTGSLFEMAIYPALFIAYLRHFAPDAVRGSREIWIGAGLIALSAVWNLLGIRKVGLSAVVFGALLLAPFAVLTVGAWLQPDLSFLHSRPAPHGDLLAGVLVAMWNYMGWDNASTIAGEVDRPQRTYPLAMAGTLLLVTLGYVLPIAAVSNSGLPVRAWSTGSWADVAGIVLADMRGVRWLVAAITLSGLLSALGTLNSLTLTLSRVPAVLAEDGYLPRILARRSASTGAPWVSVIACSIAWALCLQLSFVKLVMLDVLLTGSSILLEFATLIALRIREPELERPYRVPGGLPGVIAISVPPAALLALAVLRNDAEPVGPISALQLGLILIALGFVAYLVARRRAGTQSAGADEPAQPA